MTEDGKAIVGMLRDGTKRMGWSKTARLSGVERSALHRALHPSRERGPSFETVQRVANALGIRLTAEPL